MTILSYFTINIQECFHLSYLVSPIDNQLHSILINVSKRFIYLQDILFVLAMELIVYIVFNFLYIDLFFEIHSILIINSHINIS